MRIQKVTVLNQPAENKEVNLSCFCGSLDDGSSLYDGIFSSNCTFQKTADLKKRVVPVSRHAERRRQFNGFLHNGLSSYMHLTSNQRQYEHTNPTTTTHNDDVYTTDSEGRRIRKKSTTKITRKRRVVARRRYVDENGEVQIEEIDLQSLTDVSSYFGCRTTISREPDDVNTNTEAEVIRDQRGRISKSVVTSVTETTRKERISPAKNEDEEKKKESREDETAIDLLHSPKLPTRHNAPYHYFISHVTSSADAEATPTLSPLHCSRHQDMRSLLPHAPLHAKTLLHIQRTQNFTPKKEIDTMIITRRKVHRSIIREEKEEIVEEMIEAAEDVAEEECIPDVPVQRVEVFRDIVRKNITASSDFLKQQEVELAPSVGRKEVPKVIDEEETVFKRTVHRIAERKEVIPEPELIQRLVTVNRLVARRPVKISRPSFVEIEQELAPVKGYEVIEEEAIPPPMEIEEQQHIPEPFVKEDVVFRRQVHRRVVMETIPEEEELIPTPIKTEKEEDIPEADVEENVIIKRKVHRLIEPGVIEDEQYHEELVRNILRRTVTVGSAGFVDVKPELQPVIGKEVLKEESVPAPVELKEQEHVQEPEVDEDVVFRRQVHRVIVPEQIEEEKDHIGIARNVLRKSVSVGSPAFVDITPEIEPVLGKEVLQDESIPIPLEIEEQEHIPEPKIDEDVTIRRQVHRVTVPYKAEKERQHVGLTRNVLRKSISIGSPALVDITPEIEPVVGKEVLKDESIPAPLEIEEQEHIPEPKVDKDVTIRRQVHRVTVQQTVEEKKPSIGIARSIFRKPISIGSQALLDITPDLEPNEGKELLKEESVVAPLEIEEEEHIPQPKVDEDVIVKRQVHRFVEPHKAEKERQHVGVTRNVLRKSISIGSPALVDINPEIEPVLGKEVLKDESIPAPLEIEEQEHIPEPKVDKDVTIRRQIHRVTVQQTVEEKKPSIGIARSIFRKPISIGSQALVDITPDLEPNEGKELLKEESVVAPLEIEEQEHIPQPKVDEDVIVKRQVHRFVEPHKAEKERQHVGITRNVLRKSISIASPELVDITPEIEPALGKEDLKDESIPAPLEIEEQEHIPEPKVNEDVTIRRQVHRVTVPYKAEEEQPSIGITRSIYRKPISIGSQALVDITPDLEPHEGKEVLKEESVPAPLEIGEQEHIPEPAVDEDVIFRRHVHRFIVPQKVEEEQHHVGISRSVLRKSINIGSAVLLDEIPEVEPYQGKEICLLEPEEEVNVVVSRQVHRYAVPQEVEPEQHRVGVIRKVLRKSLSVGSSALLDITPEIEPVVGKEVLKDEFVPAPVEVEEQENIPVPEVDENVIVKRKVHRFTAPEIVEKELVHIGIKRNVLRKSISIDSPSLLDIIPEIEPTLGKEVLKNEVIPAPIEIEEQENIPVPEVKENVILKRKIHRFTTPEIVEKQPVHIGIKRNVLRKSISIGSPSLLDITPEIEPVVGKEVLRDEFVPAPVEVEEQENIPAPEIEENVILKRKIHRFTTPEIVEKEPVHIGVTRNVLRKSISIGSPSFLDIEPEIEPVVGKEILKDEFVPTPVEIGEQENIPVPEFDENVIVKRKVHRSILPEIVEKHVGISRSIFRKSISIGSPSVLDITPEIEPVLGKEVLKDEFVPTPVKIEEQENVPVLDIDEKVVVKRKVHRSILPEIVEKHIGISRSICRKSITIGSPALLDIKPDLEPVEGKELLKDEFIPSPIELEEQEHIPEPAVDNNLIFRRKVHRSILPEIVEKHVGISRNIFRKPITINSPALLDTQLELEPDKGKEALKDESIPAPLEIEEQENLPEPDLDENVIVRRKVHRSILPEILEKHVGISRSIFRRSITIDSPALLDTTPELEPDKGKETLKTELIPSPVEVGEQEHIPEPEMEEHSIARRRVHRYILSEIPEHHVDITRSILRKPIAIESKALVEDTPGFNPDEGKETIKEEFIPVPIEITVQESIPEPDIEENVIVKRKVHRYASSETKEELPIERVESSYCAHCSSCALCGRNQHRHICHTECSFCGRFEQGQELLGECSICRRRELSSVAHTECSSCSRVQNNYGYQNDCSLCSRRQHHDAHRIDSSSSWQSECSTCGRSKQDQRSLFTNRPQEYDRYEMWLNSEFTKQFTQSIREIIKAEFEAAVSKPTEHVQETTFIEHSSSSRVSATTLDVEEVVSEPVFEVEQESAPELMIEATVEQGSAPELTVEANLYTNVKNEAEVEIERELVSDPIIVGEKECLPHQLKSDNNDVNMMIETENEEAPVVNHLNVLHEVKNKYTSEPEIDIELLSTKRASMNISIDSDNTVENEDAMESPTEATSEAVILQEESVESSVPTVDIESSSEDTEQTVVVAEVPVRDLELCTEAITVLEKDDNGEDVLGKITTSTIEVDIEETARTTTIVFMDSSTTNRVSMEIHRVEDKSKEDIEFKGMETNKKEEEGEVALHSCELFSRNVAVKGKAVCVHGLCEKVPIKGKPSCVKGHCNKCVSAVTITQRSLDLQNHESNAKETKKNVIVKRPSLKDFFAQPLDLIVGEATEDVKQESKPAVTVTSRETAIEKTSEDIVISPVMIENASEMDLSTKPRVLETEELVVDMEIAPVVIAEQESAPEISLEVIETNIEHSAADSAITMEVDIIHITKVIRRGDGSEEVIEESTSIIPSATQTSTEDIKMMEASTLGTMNCAVERKQSGFIEVLMQTPYEERVSFGTAVKPIKIDIQEIMCDDVKIKGKPAYTGVTCNQMLLDDKTLFKTPFPSMMQPLRQKLREVSEHNIEEFAIKGKHFSTVYRDTTLTTEKMMTRQRIENDGSSWIADTVFEIMNPEDIRGEQNEDEEDEEATDSSNVMNIFVKPCRKVYRKVLLDEYGTELSVNETFENMPL